MKKIIFLAFALIGLSAMNFVNGQTSVWDGTYEPFANGNGTQGSPYLIENAKHLAYLTYLVNNGVGANADRTVGVNTYYKMMINIDLNGSQSFQWTPIGYHNSTTDHYYFGGHFDGNGKTIANLFINSTTVQHGGLFGLVNGGSIRNVGVIGNSLIQVNFPGPNSFAGAIIGFSFGNVTLEKVYNNKGVVSSNGYSGGIIGYSNATTINNCYNTGGSLSYYFSGGIVGYSNDISTINNCYNTGEIGSGIFNTYSGGIVGSGSIITISNCYNTGKAYHAIIVSGGAIVTNTYYLNTCSDNNSNGGESRTDAFMKSEEMVTLLGNAYLQDTEPYLNLGYPRLAGMIYPIPISVTTLDATNITLSSATLNGTTDFGDATVIKQGFIFTKPDGIDTIALSNTITTLTYDVAGLTRATTFSYKTYCTTEGGTVYGEEKQFTTLPFNQDGMSNLIENIDDMLLLAKLVGEGNSFNGQKFILVNNITLPIIPNNINAIGTYPSRPFCGEFDGNVKKIYNVYIDHPNTPYQGLFGYAKNASIYNLWLVNITASGRDFTGGMIAYAENSSITACGINGGTLFALSYCGGLIGYQTPGTNSIITSCYNNSCTVTGNNYVGGLLGYSYKGTVRSSYVSTPVEGIFGTTGAIIGGALDVLFYYWGYDSTVTNLPAIGENLITGKGDDDGGMSSEEMRKPEFVNTLNQGLPTPAWKMDYNPPINDGFPILIWQTQTTGIVNLEKESNINLYPNPVKDNFTISFEDETKGQVFIYDMLGKVVNNQEINGNKTTISVVHLSKGVYIVRVVTEGKTFGVGKIIKQ